MKVRARLKTSIYEDKSGVYEVTGQYWSDDTQTGSEWDTAEYDSFPEISSEVINWTVTNSYDGMGLYVVDNGIIRLKTISELEAE